MMSRPVAVALLAAGCLTAAGGGAYLAVRQNATLAQAAEPAPMATPGVPAPAAQPVSETEAVIEPPKAEPEAAPLVTPAPRREPRPAAVPRRPTTPAVARAEAPVVRDAATVPPVERAPEPVDPVPDPPPAEALSPAAPPPVPEPAARVDAPTGPTIEEITIPASSVIGLEVETPITSEKARVEDRVDARVSRDVYVEGKLAIPSGARMIGSVTVVERGGKVKERARLGVRFHTLVLADGRQVDVRTDTIFREGQSPSGESSRKIGGAAVGGAVLGAIMGGGKGAMIGGAAGAAGGTAAVMAGGRNAATIASGTVVNARLASPVTIEIERR